MYGQGAEATGPTDLSSKIVPFKKDTKLGQRG
jgi:hypothetical protein